MECLRSKSVLIGYVGARRKITATLKRTSDGCVVLVRAALLLRRKATISADLNMLWQRWDEVKMLMSGERWMTWSGELGCLLV